jgi:hypothetical protein
MLKHTNTTPQGPRSRLTLEDGMTLWRARDVYRVRRGIEGFVILFLLLEALSFLGSGRWDLLLTILGFQIAVLWGGRWLLRKAWTWSRTRWHRLILVILLGATLGGCESMAREVVKLHGVKVDPFPGQCAPESVQVGYCVKTTQERKGTP